MGRQERQGVAMRRRGTDFRHRGLRHPAAAEFALHAGAVGQRSSHTLGQIIHRSPRSGATDLRCGVSGPGASARCCPVRHGN